ncbi:hypothetical protein [Bradyrhizobium embrapense]|uniref:hypothetical protein n=1 Tax=Bradyrhizobium embrapense TaxID=630921 RepID=UPI0007C4BF21|nr:hypothetical protein [Bradyrhizobium embrapense]
MDYLLVRSLLMRTTTTMHSNQDGLRIDVAASISVGMPVIHFNDGGSPVQADEFGETAAADHPQRGERRMSVPQALLMWICSSSGEAWPSLELILGAAPSRQDRIGSGGLRFTCGQPPR